MIIFFLIIVAAQIKEVFDKQKIYSEVVQINEVKIPHIILHCCVNGTFYSVLYRASKRVLH